MNVGIVLLVIMIIIVVYFVAFAIKNKSEQKNYDKAITNSSGYEKMRLFNRRNVSIFMYESKGEIDVVRFEINMAALMAHTLLNDYFYGSLKTTSETLNVEDILNGIVERMQENQEQADYVAAGAGGIALGIVMYKLSIETGEPVDKKLLKDFVNSMQTSELCKKKVLKIAESYIGYREKKSHNFLSGLGPLAWEMMGLSIKDTRDANPFLATALNFATVETMKRIDVTHLAEVRNKNQ